MHSKQENVYKNDGQRSLEIDYFSIVLINAIRVRLVVAALVNNVFLNVQANIAAGAR